MKQFGIRHLLAGIVLVSIAMGLLASRWNPAVFLGIAILVACVGGFFSSMLMFVSDLIDGRRIDDRRLLSRFFNFCGLLLIVGTAITVLVLGIVFLFQMGFWLLEQVPGNGNTAWAFEYHGWPHA